MILLLLIALGQGAPASFWVGLPGGGPAVVEGRIHNATYDGVFLLDMGDGGCASTLRGFRCTVTRGPLTQLTVFYRPLLAPRCGRLPRLDVYVDGELYASQAEPVPAGLHCMGVPLLWR